MRRLFTRRHVLVLFVVCALMANAAVARAGHITGTIRITTPEGITHSGDWIRVLLTSSAVSIPDIPSLEGLAPLARYDLIVSAHMDFYVNYQKHMSEPGFIVSSVLTTDDGGFKFVDVAPGRYFVVVTFPSSIGGYKVAWQVPVTVPDSGDPNPLALGWHNMLLPTQKR
jgi:hypothetical protein